MKTLMAHTEPITLINFSYSKLNTMRSINASFIINEDEGGI